MRHALALTIMALVLASQAQAAQMLNDDFSDGDRTQTGATDTDWWKASSAKGAITAPDERLLLSGSSLDWYQGIVGDFTATTLEDPTGNPTAVNKIVLSFDLQFDKSHDGTDRTYLRFGLFNDRGTPTTEDQTTNGTAKNDYGFRVNLGTGASTSSIVREAGSDGSELGTGGDGTTLGAVGSVISPPAGTFAPTNILHMVLTIERMDATTLAFGLSMNGDDLLNSAISDVPPTVDRDYFTFNEVFVGRGTASNNAGFYLDNVVVETFGVPEPATAGLLLLGGGALLRRRRR
jgi:hypothetical protein